MEGFPFGRIDDDDYWPWSPPKEGYAEALDLVAEAVGAYAAAVALDVYLEVTSELPPEE
jgi:hypothetical protein